VKLPVSTSNSRSRSCYANLLGSRLDSGRIEFEELLDPLLLSLPLVSVFLVEDLPMFVVEIERKLLPVLVFVGGVVNIGFFGKAF